MFAAVIKFQLMMNSLIIKLLLQNYWILVQDLFDSLIRGVKETRKILVDFYHFKRMRQKTVILLLNVDILAKLLYYSKHLL